jgi:hypothetical protein
MKVTIKNVNSVSVDRLIWIAKSNTNFWSKESKLQAQIELNRRNISEREQNENWSKIDTKLEKQLEKQYIESTGLDKYEKYEYFFLSPFYLIMEKYFSKTLYNDKSVKAFKQIMILIFLGLLFWIIVVILVAYIIYIIRGK